MELKLKTEFAIWMVSYLLIVPYGIETSQTRPDHQTNLLLIVPYGIETKQILIEITITQLLIVPYGIETFQAKASILTNQSFNRTLWN